MTPNAKVALLWSRQVTAWLQHTEPTAFVLPAQKQLTPDFGIHMTFQELLNNLRGTPLSTGQIAMAVIEAAANLKEIPGW